MDISQPIVIFWFRRDLRLVDNNALFQALSSGLKVLPVFIFDHQILRSLAADDKRVSFIYQAIEHLNKLLIPFETAIQLFKGDPHEVFRQLVVDFPIKKVFANHDYEPYAIARDIRVQTFLEGKGVVFQTYKDQVVFEKDEITKQSGEPYTVFTPFSNRWIEKLNQNNTTLNSVASEKLLHNFVQLPGQKILSLTGIGFTESDEVFQPFNLNESNLETYHKTRDIPSLDSTSKVSVHLRFGTVSIRKMVVQAIEINAVWLNELIWREFFMQILWHFPHVVNHPFKPKYKYINWVNNEKDFELWSQGQTGFPLVDAGMRELNATGFMHNRVRMVTASFLVKHLLVNWQWGEAYFASKLLDFELASNNGNWQWAAGTGCDAAPYFRIFNPTRQTEKFDPENNYIKKWVPEFGTKSYKQPIVDHSFARNRCIETYKAAF